MRENQAAYENDFVIKRYQQMRSLQKPEQVILEATQKELQGSRFLDIGVGTGRTTSYFGRHSDYYLGIDISPKMIKACAENTDFQGSTYHFQVMDAVKMLSLAEKPFDYALFSYNGLDLVNDSDRQIIFANLKQMLKKDGWLVFSTHNIMSLNDLFSHHRYDTSMSLLRNVYWLLKERYYRYQFEKRNSYPENSNFQLLHDGSINFKTSTYYIKPAFQVQQLHDHKFHSIRAFSLSGAEILLKDLNLVTDPWIYFLCKNG